jgi:outer membrane protein assembly factor BamB
MPAWPTEERMPFDQAYQPVVSNGALFFGSSTDGKLYALDSATGQVRWAFYTDGPIRFAPVIWKDRVMVASDDGQLYALTAKDGKLLWTHRGGPDARMFLGNDRMISRWPMRGGPVVRDDVVYVAAGIWPSEGIFIHALDAKSGKVLWRNEDSGSIEMNQPHGGARAKSGVSAQGYFLATEDQLFVPTGRAVPAAFDRATGTFSYFHLQENGHIGGTRAAVIGSRLYNGGAAFDNATGDLVGKPGGGVYARSEDGVVRATGKRVIGYAWETKELVDRKGKKTIEPTLVERWAVEGVAGDACVVVAQDQVVVGGAGVVAGINIKSKAIAWSLQVDGTVYGLAVAEGALFVSTDFGKIYRFGKKASKPPHIVKAGTGAAPEPSKEDYAAAAEAIVRDTGIVEGFCLDLDCGDGQLAYELAKRTQLQIYAIDSDPAKVARARRNLEAAGLYGIRVMVHQGDPGAMPYPKYFANLIVSGRSVAQGVDAVNASDLGRVLRPYGGIALLGKTGAMERTDRGPLEGAGSWTHQYTNPANTCASVDTLVKGPLGLLWYRDADLPMPQRHGRGPAPLFADGRLFVEGMDALRAIDAYNGRTLWDFPLKGILATYHQDHLSGVAITNSNFCVGGDDLYVRRDNKCFRIEVATGKMVQEFSSPKGPDGHEGVWGYLAYDGDTLFGSISNTDHIVRWGWKKADMSKLYSESHTFFAIDPETGKEKWRYEAKDSIRHNAVAIGGGAVFLIDREPADVDRLEHELAAEKRRGKKAPDEGQKTKEHKTGKLLALDARTGEVLWEDDQDIYGTTLALSVEHKMLLMSYQPTRFKLPSERGGRMAVYATANGYRMWDYGMKYVTRPLINDHTIYTQGGAWDLATGLEKTFNFDRSYGCGQLAGSKYMMLFRSATLGYFDLSREEGTENYGGVRPGCWINAIPAGGLVLVPDASSGCRCSYLNRASLALHSMGE